MSCFGAAKITQQTLFEMFNVELRYLGWVFGLRNFPQIFQDDINSITEEGPERSPLPHVDAEKNENDDQLQNDHRAHFRHLKFFCSVV